MSFKTIITSDQAKAQSSCVTLMGEAGKGMFLRECKTADSEVANRWISSGELPDVSVWDADMVAAVTSLYACSDVSEEVGEIAMARLGVMFV